MKRKIAFCKLGSFSHTNESVEAFLRENFPDYEIEGLDLMKAIKRRPLVVLLNALLTALIYGPAVLRNRDERANFFFKTPFIWRQMGREISRYYADKRDELAFVLQTQSSFYAKVDDLPLYVYTDHTILCNLNYRIYDKREFASKKRLELEREMYAGARHIFVSAKHVEESLIEQYGCAADRVSTIHMGNNSPGRLSTDDVDPARFRRKNILFIGIDWERKGGPVLVEAFKRVREKHPDATLTIIGNRPPVSEPGVEILGRLPLGEVRAHFDRASVFCLPSLAEPFGVAALEAARNALPVVVTRTGGFLDYVEDGKSGFLVTPGDSVELAEALDKLLQSWELCQAFGLRGREIAIERFAWPVVGRKLADYVKQDLARHPATSAQSAAVAVG